MSVNPDKLHENREAFIDYYVENPEASIDAALKVAVREKRAQGLTMGIAKTLRHEAEKVRAERERLAAEKRAVDEAAERAKLATRKCARCGSKEHWASQCTVQLPEEAAPHFNRETGLQYGNVYEPPEGEDRDDEATWLGAVRHVLSILATGEIMSVTDAWTYGGKLGPRTLWRSLLDGFTGYGYLEQAKGTERGPQSTILWAVRNDKTIELLALAKDSPEEQLAGLVWPTGGEAGEVLEVAEPAEPVASGPPVLLNGSTQYVVQLVEAQLKLQQATLEAMQMLRREMEELRVLIQQGRTP